MILMHGEKLYGAESRETRIFPTSAEYRYRQTPTEPFGIVVLQTQYFAPRKSSGNIPTNKLL